MASPAPARFATVPALPRELQVEVTGACNLRCRMCLVRYARPVGRGEGALSYEQFLGLVDALPDLDRLTLQGLGEPLLSPHLVDMVAHAAERGIAVGFNTNATLLDEATARRLVEAGCGWLHVSLDGATAQTYEDVRHGTGFAPRPGQFDRVVANLRGLLAVRRELRSARPHVELVFVAMRRNVHELEGLVELAAGLAVDAVRVQNLSHTFDDVDPAGSYAEIRAYARDEAIFGDDADRLQASFARAADRAAELDVALRLPRLDPRERPAAGTGPGRPVRAGAAAERGGSQPGSVPSPAPGAAGDGPPGCTWPWDAAYVTHRGEVQPCCMVMGNDRATLGDLREDGFAAIWRSDAYREFRERLLTPGDPPGVCRGCSLYRGVF
jgi:radical SAM protein with 4Fe4S-binding SPASM domain